MRLSMILALFGLSLLASPALAEGEPIPKAAQGVWAEGGACHGDTVTFTARMLQYKGAEAEPVYFAPNDSPTGNGGIHYVEEGNVDGFEFVANDGIMLYHPEGYGMGAPEVYRRCP